MNLWWSGGAITHTLVEANDQRLKDQKERCGSYGDPSSIHVQPSPSQSANQSAQSEQPTKSAQSAKPEPKKPSADRKVTTIVYSRYHWVTTIWQGFRKWVITVWLW